MKILAVDDDQLALDLLTIMAARGGFKDVSVAPSGEAALHQMRIADADFDCLVFDISMPGMDGIELCSIVRSLPAYRKTPIIMLTAMSEKHYIDRAFKAGATDYANTPFDVVELSARLRMAEEVVVARREAGLSKSTSSTVQTNSAYRHSFDLADEVQLAGVDDVISRTSLGNYLQQLSRTGLAGMQVFAVKIDRIDTIYARATDDEFLHALAEVADAIGHVLRASGHLMAYAGNGIFLIVSSKAKLESSRDLEADLQYHLDGKNLEYGDDTPFDIEVSIGNPIRPNVGVMMRIRTALDRAIARAENREARKQADPKPPSIRLIGR